VKWTQKGSGGGEGKPSPDGGRGREYKLTKKDLNLSGSPGGAYSHREKAPKNDRNGVNQGRRLDNNVGLRHCD